MAQPDSIVKSIADKLVSDCQTILAMSSWTEKFINENLLPKVDGAKEFKIKEHLTQILAIAKILIKYIEQGPSTEATLPDGKMTSIALSYELCQVIKVDTTTFIPCEYLTEIIYLLIKNNLDAINKIIVSIDNLAQKELYIEGVSAPFSSIEEKLIALLKSNPSNYAGMVSVYSTITRSHQDCAKIIPWNLISIDTIFALLNELLKQKSAPQVFAYFCEVIKEKNLQRTFHNSQTLIADKKIIALFKASISQKNIAVFYNLVNLFDLEKYLQELKTHCNVSFCTLIYSLLNKKIELTDAGKFISAPYSIKLHIFALLCFSVISNLNVSTLDECKVFFKPIFKLTLNESVIREICNFVNLARFMENAETPTKQAFFKEVTGTDISSSDAMIIGIFSNEKLASTIHKYLAMNSATQSAPLIAPPHQKPIRSPQPITANLTKEIPQETRPRTASAPPRPVRPKREELNQQSTSSTAVNTRQTRLPQSESTDSSKLTPRAQSADAHPPLGQYFFGGLPDFTVSESPRDHGQQSQSTGQSKSITKNP